MKHKIRALGILKVPKLQMKGVDIPRELRVVESRTANRHTWTTIKEANVKTIVDDVIESHGGALRSVFGFAVTTAGVELAKQDKRSMKLVATKNTFKLYASPQKEIGVCRHFLLLALTRAHECFHVDQVAVAKGYMQELLKAFITKDAAVVRETLLQLFGSNFLAYKFDALPRKG